MQPMDGMTLDQPSVDRIRKRHEALLATLRSTAERNGHDPTRLRIVGVTKTWPVEVSRAAIDAGLTMLGESRVREAEPKVAALPDAEWHLVGRLQSNKARRAVELFETIQTVNSVGLARRLAALSAALGRSPLRVLVQVNVDADPAKAGFRPADVQAALGGLASLGDLRIEGLMTVGRMTTDPEDARPTFRALSELSRSLRGRDAGLGHELSMGMSDDFDVAIEEGATIVRIGRALFGERPPG